MKKPYKSIDRFRTIMAAKMLYADGLKFAEIGKKVGVHERTIARWADKYNFKEFRQKVEDKLSETVAEMKERHIKIVKATIAKYIDNLRNDEIKISANEAAKMMQHELEIHIPKTISQFNFMKKEQNVNILTKEEVNRLLEVL